MGGPLRFAVLGLLCPLLVGLSVTPQFQLSPSRVQTGTAVLDTTGYYGNATADTLNQVSFSLSFASSVGSAYGAATSLNSMKYDISSNYRINITTSVCNFYVSGLNICLLSQSVSQLASLSIRYLAVDDPKYKIYHLYYAARFYVNSQGSNSFNFLSPITSDFTVASGLNTSGTLRAFALLTGFNASSDATYLYDLTLTASYTALGKFRVRMSSGSTTTIQVSSIQYSLMGYNEEVSQSWPFPAIRITFGSFTPYSPFSSNTSLIKQFNTFWGLTAFNISSNAYFQFNSTVSASTSISASTTNSPSSFTWMAFLFEFKECNSSSTPYYMVAEDLCYDICPNRYYESNAQKTCENCTNYDCLKCITNGTCTTCDNTTDHRQLNAYGRCQPIQGYYQSNVSVALPCDSSCRTCAGGTASDCTGCFGGQYVSGGACVACMPNCSSCVNATYCSSCNNSMVGDGAGGCTYPFDCLAIANCQTCDPFTGCSHCYSGYNLTNSSACSSICGDGMLITASQQCDDNNTMSSDGCSAACTVQMGYYCIGANGSLSTCYACPTGCVNCTNSTSCVSCSTGYFLVVTVPQQLCQANCSTLSMCLTCSFDNSSALVCHNCTAGYTVVNSTCGPLCGDHLVLAGEECDDGNLVAGDGCDQFCKIEDNFACVIVGNASVCSACLGATYQAANKSACLPCANYDCSKCVSSGNCTYCDPLTHRYLDNVTERCLPANGFYDNGSNASALACEPTCSTCNGGNATNCLSCGQTRVLSNGSCLLCTTAVGLGCSQCTVGGTNFICTKCQGSTLSNGTCVFASPSEISPPSLPSFLPILLGIVGAALLLCCCLLLFCCWRRRKNQENKVAEQMPENEVVVEREQGQEISDPFDEKLLTHQKKKKYRGQNKPEKEVKKKRRTHIIQDTEQNDLSMEEFKQTSPIKQTTNLKQPREDLPKDTKKIPMTGGPLIINQWQGEQPVGDGDGDEGDVEQVSQKHVVGGGFEELPPEPKKEVVESSQKSSAQNSELFKSEASDDFGSERGR